MSREKWYEQNSARGLHLITCKTFSALEKTYQEKMSPRMSLAICYQAEVSDPEAARHQLIEFLSECEAFSAHHEVHALKITGVEIDEELLKKIRSAFFFLKTLDLSDQKPITSKDLVQVYNQYKHASRFALLVSSEGVPSEGRLSFVNDALKGVDFLRFNSFLEGVKVAKPEAYSSLLESVTTLDLTQSGCSEWMRLGTLANMPCLEQLILDSNHPRLGIRLTPQHPNLKSISAVGCSLELDGIEELPLCDRLNIQACVVQPKTFLKLAARYYHPEEENKGLYFEGVQIKRFSRSKDFLLNEEQIESCARLASSHRDLFSFSAQISSVADGVAEEKSSLDAKSIDQARALQLLSQWAHTTFEFHQEEGQWSREASLRAKLFGVKPYHNLERFPSQALVSPHKDWSYLVQELSASLRAAIQPNPAQIQAVMYCVVFAENKAIGLKLPLLGGAFTVKEIRAAVAKLEKEHALITEAVQHYQKKCEAIKAGGDGSLLGVQNQLGEILALQSGCALLLKQFRCLDVAAKNQVLSQNETVSLSNSDVLSCFGLKPMPELIATGAIHGERHLPDDDEQTAEDTSQEAAGGYALLDDDDDDSPNPRA